MLEESVNQAKIRGEFATKIREEFIVTMKTETEEKRKSFLRVHHHLLPLPSALF